MTPRLVLLAAAIAAAAPAAAGETALAPGAYEVVHRLDLPHLENRGERTSAVCLEGEGPRAFPVLSDNNPLAGCPARNVRRSGDEVTFEIVCPGGGAARASAVFTIQPDRFQGSIAMTMGGKNMTMTEVQRGRRVGDCARAGAAR